jgi:hypothetical protein
MMMMQCEVLHKNIIAIHERFFSSAKEQHQDSMTYRSHKIGVIPISGNSTSQIRK